MTSEEMHLDNALARLQKAHVYDVSAELTYGQAYQRLVQMGLRPQIRRKYRGTK